jgi:hypothetical protein
VLGHSVLNIGLARKSTRPFRLNAKPAGTMRLAPDFFALYTKVDKAEDAAIKKGGDAPTEDDSNGYALLHDPAAPVHEVSSETRDSAFIPDAG